MYVFRREMSSAMRSALKMASTGDLVWHVQNRICPASRRRVGSTLLGGRSQFVNFIVVHSPNINRK
jgi:hypothetical protein